MSATDPSPKLQMQDVSRRFGDVVAVDSVSIDIFDGSFVALVGTSGSGKSTLLKIVNRLVEPDMGQVLLAGHPVTDHAAHMLRRKIGYVFQNIGLFPHLNVAANIAIGLRLSGASDTSDRVAEMLQLVDLAPELGLRMPSELSGGQAQRVGVARALAPAPTVLLMDEPFGALDPVTRDVLGRKVRALHDRLGLTTVMVTHDMSEALLLADRILVMAQGRIAADGTPAELMAGRGGAVADALVAIPREQARRLVALSSR
jgi:osmoprotectant transport system ATP-binding protein